MPCHNFSGGRFMKSALKLSVVITAILSCCTQGSYAQSFVFSVRPEGFGISNAMSNDSTDDKLKGTPVDKRLAVGGWTLESGVLLDKGGLYTVSVHGGGRVGARFQNRRGVRRVGVMDVLNANVTNKDIDTGFTVL